MTDPQAVAAKLTAQLRTSFGQELHSVLIFGSVARGEAIPGISDLNILVLLDSLSPPILTRAAPILQRWIRLGNTPPHLYSVPEWAGMRDALAIELADMNDAREVLWGPDPVAVDSVSYTALRLQTEREIRDTLAQLRLRLMVAASGPRDIGALLMSGVPSFSAYVRAVLRLVGEVPSIVSAEAIERGAALIEADAAPLLTCLDARRKMHLLEFGLDHAYVDRYLAFALSLLRYVHNLPMERPEPRGGPDAVLDRSRYTLPVSRAGGAS